GRSAGRSSGGRVLVHMGAAGGGVARRDPALAVLVVKVASRRSGDGRRSHGVRDCDPGGYLLQIMRRDAARSLSLPNSLSVAVIRPSVGCEEQYSPIFLALATNFSVSITAGAFSS